MKCETGTRLIETCDAYAAKFGTCQGEMLNPLGSGSLFGREALFDAAESLFEGVHPFDDFIQALLQHEENLSHPEEKESEQGDDELD